MKSNNTAYEIVGERIRKQLTAVAIAQMVFNALWICGETISFFVLRARNLAADAAYIPIIGVYSLWILFNKDVKALFKRQQKHKGK
jgi:uncharacterized RDD family membrane protein YckC